MVLNTLARKCAADKLPELNRCCHVAILDTLHDVGGYIAMRNDEGGFRRRQLLRVDIGGANWRHGHGLLHARSPPGRHHLTRGARKHNQARIQCCVKVIVLLAMGGQLLAELQTDGAILSAGTHKRYATARHELDDARALFSRPLAVRLAEHVHHLRTQLRSRNRCIVSAKYQQPITRYQQINKQTNKQQTNKKQTNTQTNKQTKTDAYE